MDIYETCSKTYACLISSVSWQTMNRFSPMPWIKQDWSIKNRWKFEVKLSSTETIHKIAETIVRVMQPAVKVVKMVSDKVIALAKTVGNIAHKVLQTLDEYKGYIIGPTISLAVATIVRFSLGKRVPTSGPLYLSICFAGAALITVWAVQFFKHPKNQKIVQAKGVAGAIAGAVPFARPRIVEPMHSRHFLSLDRLELLMQKPVSVCRETISEADAKNTLSGFKQYCDWVKKKIKLATATGETLAILKKTLTQHFILTLKNLVIHGNEALVREFLAFTSSDPFVTRIMSEEERKIIYAQFGYRLSFLLNKSALIPLFPEVATPDFTVACMDAIVCSNPDRVIDLTNKGSINATKVIVYGDSHDLLLNKLNFRLPPMNLVQGAVLMGDVPSLQRVLASIADPIDWYQTDTRGLNLLTLAALSGSKAMWDFVREFSKKLPAIETQDYLYLLYAAIKGHNEGVFDELIAFIFEDEHKDVVGALIVDLYEKALALNDSKLITKLNTHEALSKELAKASSYKPVLKAAIRGGNFSVFSSNLEKLKKVDTENALLMKELFEEAFRADTPNEAIISALKEYEATLVTGYLPANFDLSSSDLACCVASLKDESLDFVFSRIAKEQIARLLSENGMLFQRIVKKPAVLSKIIDKCDTDRFLNAACAKEAIKQQQVDTLRMLCGKGLDTLKKIPDSHESLLSYAMLSFNPDIIQVILSTCPPLSSMMINELKTRITELKCHAEDEVAYSHIIRMLDAKSLESGSAKVTDHQQYLAELKQGAMNFNNDVVFVPKEEPSRGLLATGLGLLGFL